MSNHDPIDNEELPETHQAGQNPSRSILFVLIGTVACASVLTIAIALLSNDSDKSNAPLIVAAESFTPVAAVPTETQATVAAATETVPPEPTNTATPAPVASSITATPTIGDAWSATPIASTPTPSASLEAVAQALAGTIEQQFGVRIVTEGQDWGADKDAQLRNIGAVGDALAGLPLSARSTAAANGPLAFLSNHKGRTEAGWQPYGDRESNFYANEDMTSAGHVRANQVVLQPGSTAQTITHEIMHAIQMRDVAPGAYVLALLTPEMKSFMEATGWTQTATDDEVRAAVSNGWESVDGLFEYHGRALTYTNEFGTPTSLFAPNPLEAYAEAGGLYYGHSEHTTLPDWPEYWGWFASHLG